MTESNAVEREWLITWNVNAEDGIAYTLFYVVGKLEPYERALAGVKTMKGYDLTPVHDGGFYAFVRGRETEQSRQFHMTFQQPTLMVVPPLAYRPHGIVTFDVVGEPAVLEGVLDKLPEGITAEVRKIGEYDAHPETFTIDLTARQREALAVARRVGYYEVPRTGSVADVAAELDCASSTASNHLRKAEARLVQEVIAT
ncbi:helix-turn-helix domain-containing protein [Halococcus sp. IIIV-5B]|uniref:helix-turn-helix domain-containing protein n=1 Tax=Halococcus sp. IIIV-5B TaxID=2321230 RepID=UPI000E718CE6|nr:helix-turn-helix domain-containing protein [Halococcus sp. IIIV-5B]RJT07595.1 transcriptional regulator [Halococcus sp. IIIV-5B]